MERINDNRGGKFRLSTGREFRAYGWHLSICDDPEDWSARPGRSGLAYGYDGEAGVGEFEAPLTVGERHEIADHMIALWAAWKSQQR